MHLKGFFAACVAACLAVPDALAADEKDVCVKAAEQAQNARIDGKLTEARAGFVTCARPVCPVIVREDCTRWVADVDASIPSIVVDAVWADGRDVTGLTVRLDGRVVGGAEKGRAIALDPGEHAFRFEAPGAAPVEVRHVIREGEKNRILHLVFAPLTPVETATTDAGASTAQSGPTPTSSETSTPPPGLWEQPAPESSGVRASTRAPVPIASLVLGGVGILSFGGFAYLSLAGTSQLDSLRSTCVHSCNPSDVSFAKNEVLLGDILAYVGLAATGAAVWLYLARPDVPATSAQAR